MRFRHGRGGRGWGSYRAVVAVPEGIVIGADACVGKDEKDDIKTVEVPENEDTEPDARDPTTSARL